MATPADLTPSAVPQAPPELRTAEVLDEAVAEGQLVRCTIAALDPLLATDPMPWRPYVGAAGIFYPKRGDSALVGQPLDGPPVILEWWPSATEPDVSL